MSEMVERVAKAIDENETFRSVIYDSGEGLSGNLEIAEEIARVAIAAMREPTREMLKSSDSIMGGGFQNSRSDREIWEAMIDAALR